MFSRGRSHFKFPGIKPYFTRELEEKNIQLSLQFLHQSNTIGAGYMENLRIEFNVRCYVEYLSQEQW